MTVCTGGTEGVGFSLKQRAARPEGWGNAEPGKRGLMALPSTHCPEEGPCHRGLTVSIFPPLLPYLSRDLMSPSSTEKRERQGQICK